MKKGSITRAIWTIIEIVFIVIALLVIIKTVGVISNWSEARATSGSAALLADAITDVCNRRDPSYTRTVMIRMPQDVNGFVSKIGEHTWFSSLILGSGLDPKWVIYYGDKIDASVIAAQAAGDALDSIEVVEHKFNWDHYPRKCPEEDHTICYGFFERDLQPKYSNLKVPPDCKIHKFWILSPCYANVTVYYDDVNNEVNFCYSSWKNPDDGNYCHGDSGLGGSIWETADKASGGALSALINTVANALHISKDNVLKHGWPYPDYSVLCGHGSHPLQRVCNGVSPSSCGGGGSTSAGSGFGDGVVGGK